MKIYNYDRYTFEYVGESEAYLDVEETKIKGEDVYSLPAYATFTKPPKTQSHEVAVYENGWQVEDDYRDCWIVNDEMHPIRQNRIGALPEGYIAITDAQYTKIVESPDFYIIEDGELVVNPNYDEIKYKQYVDYLVNQIYLFKAEKAYGGVIIDDAYIFETNQISITNTVASLALMGTKTNWKFYDTQNLPVIKELTKTQLTKIAKFGQKMIEDCFTVEGLANIQLQQATQEQVSNAQWRNDFLVAVKAQMDEVNNNLEMGL